MCILKTNDKTGHKSQHRIVIWFGNKLTSYTNITELFYHHGQLTQQFRRNNILSSYLHSNALNPHYHH